jgi:cell wall-associated NlpC family hydrolase
MSAHRARHRAPAVSPTAATQRSARELIDELTRVEAAPARTRESAARGSAPQGRAAHLPAPRRPRAAGSGLSSTTLTMLAVGAVGASTAMTGTFAAINDETPAPNSPEPGAAVPVAMDDVLIPASSPDDNALRFSSATISTAKPSSERVADASTAGTVFADDMQQTNAREIAALARSVDRERAVGGVTAAATKSIGGLGVPAALGVGRAIDQVPGAAMRATAMNAALGKIGVPYVWGAVGPKAFDCSGLVLWSFNKVGISLPRTSKAQSQVGKPVKKSELRPGDLVFFYTPVSHVGIYIGNGKFVHASEPGKPVKISPLNRFPFHNARRL